MGQVLEWQTAITTRQRVLETLDERKCKGSKQNFTTIPAKSNEDEIFSAFESDGLKLGEESCIHGS